MEVDRRPASLITFTIVFLAIYVPLETWYSLPALWDPFYIVDFIGMVLLASGILRWRRDPSARSLAVLAAGYAWEGANFWRAFFDRVDTVMAGGELRLGLAELCFAACGTIVALGALAWCLALITRRPTVHRAEPT